MTGPTRSPVRLAFKIDRAGWPTPRPWRLLVGHDTHSGRKWLPAHFWTDSGISYATKRDAVEVRRLLQTMEKDGRIA